MPSSPAAQPILTMSNIQSVYLNLMYDAFCILQGYGNRDRSVPWAPGASSAAEYILVTAKDGTIGGGGQVVAPSAAGGPSNLMEGFNFGAEDPRQVR